MKHGDKKRKFGMERKGRRALLKSLINALVRDEKIVTTEAKAKEIRPLVEKMITKAKTGNLAARRILISRLGSNTSAKKLVGTIAPRYKERAGGYTRITKMTRRKSDASPRATIGFV